MPGVFEPHPRRALALTLVLAVALSAVPLGGLASAVREPGHAGAGMSAPLPLVFDGGARGPVAGASVGGRSAPSILGGPAARAPRNIAARVRHQGRRALAASERLARLGRRQLDGG